MNTFCQTFAVIVVLSVCANSATARFFNDGFLPALFGAEAKAGDSGAAPSVESGEEEGHPRFLARRVAKSTVSEVMGCKKLPPITIFKQLNAVCEDCFQLFRDQELYHMCR